MWPEEALTGLCLKHEFLLAMGMNSWTSFVSSKSKARKDAVYALMINLAIG